jgi:glycerophosphoryl diester phosphodiesterase
MRNRLKLFVLATAVAALAAGPMTYALDARDEDRGDHSDSSRGDQRIQLGPRPFYLLGTLEPGALKSKLQQCKAGPFYRTDFSIGHRGAALQFPEHTKEAYDAGARMGAGIVECDTTFTKDGELVCRHSDCDLHTTTNIVNTPLNASCSVPWTGPNQNPGPKCCTWNLTLQQFKSLHGKMDASNPAATTAEGYLGGTASWRTDLYSGPGTLMTLRESIALNRRNGVKHTPELKGGDAGQIDAIFGRQGEYAQKFADVLDEEGVRPRDAWPQSFNVNDVLYWIQHSAYGRQAVFLVDYDADKDDIILLDEQGNPVTTPAARNAFFLKLKSQGVRIVAPPMPALLAVDGAGRIVPSAFAKYLKGVGFDIITWTFERADLRQGASKAGFYFDFDPTGKAIKTDGDMYKALDVLAKEVKILGIFSDWPATVTYYANCMGLK